MTENLNNPQSYLINTGIARPSNPDQDKFLFVITPHNLAIDCCCGCSLRTGVQIISLIFIAASLSNFFTALRMESLLDLIISGLAFILYFVAGVCILYSTINNNSTFSHIGYFIFALIFVLQFLDNVVVFILIILGYFAPLGNEDKLEVGLIFLIAVMLVMSIHLYMVWIVFCYSIHLKHKRDALLSGYIFFKYEDMPTQRQETTHATNRNQDEIPQQNY